MSITKSRFAPKYPAAAPSGAAPAGPKLADALADRDIALVRIRCRADARQRPWHDLVAFTSSFRRVFFDLTDHDTDQTIRAELIAWYIGLHPDVDWTRDHQIDLRSGAVTTAPEAWENGAIPEDDFTFGGGAAVRVAEQPVAA